MSEFVLTLAQFNPGAEPRRMSLFTLVLIVGVILFALLLMLWFLSKLYKRASKEISFVRTGFRGQKVIMNGGALVFPVLHEIIPVNMNTLRLEVQRGNEAALITRDRMRVDVRAEFYVRVKPTEDAIADAAQTLGRRTMNPESLKELVEGKFVDALRAVAAEMAMEELHEKRVDFVQKVQTAVSEDLLKNGLELETVSLTALDQTDQTYFNPQNAFDAQGLTRLTEEIEARRKQRNDIEQDTAVAIQKKNLEAERLKLELKREEEYARMAQVREVEVRKATEAAVTAQEQAAKERAAREAQIAAKQKVDQAAIMAERAVEEERIEKDRLLKEKEIAKSRAIEQADIERRKTVELAEQDRAIAVAEKSRDESVAAAEADKARALAVKAEEQVVTVRQSEIADRQKTIELIEARKQAEREAITVVVAAEAEKKSALDKAEAVKTMARADAERVTIVAQGDKEAEIMRAEAADKRYAVDAAGKRALHEAENILAPELIAMRIKLALIEHLDDIIRESVKPIEKIDGIRIYQISGLPGNNGDGQAVGGSPAGGGNLADQMVNSALRYRGQAPLVDALLKEVGLSGGSLNGLTATLDAPTGDGGAAENAPPPKA